MGFIISKERDEQGNEIEIDPAALTNSIAVCLLPSRQVGMILRKLRLRVNRCRITPRSQERAELLRREWAQAQEILDADGDHGKSPL